MGGSSATGYLAHRKQDSSNMLCFRVLARSEVLIAVAFSAYLVASTEQMMLFFQHRRLNASSAWFPAVIAVLFDFSGTGHLVTTVQCTVNVKVCGTFTFHEWGSFAVKIINGCVGFDSGSEVPSWTDLLLAGQASGWGVQGIWCESAGMSG